MPNIHVGRQPIYDDDRRVVAFELLFRDAAGANAATLDDDLATTRVIVNTFTEFDHVTLTGGRPAFVNVTESFITGAYPLPFPPSAVVLEVLEEVPATSAVLAGLARLQEAGFRLALDHFDGRPERMALLDHVSYVKLDVQDIPAGDLEEVAGLARRRGVQLIAERVETARHLEQARAAGCELFQGWLFARPDVLSMTSITTQATTVLQVVGRLSAPDPDIDEIEEIVKRDAGLTFRLLRAANSVSVTARRRIESLRDAIGLLGLAQLRAWTLLMLVNDETSAGDEALTAAVTRARTCELLARQSATARPDMAFTAGLLSSLDALLGEEIGTVLAGLVLDEALTRAVVRGEGPLGSLIRAAAAQERADRMGIELAGFDPGAVSHAYLCAVEWAQEAQAAVHAA